MIELSGGGVIMDKIINKGLAVLAFFMMLMFSYFPATVFSEQLPEPDDMDPVTPELTDDEKLNEELTDEVIEILKEYHVDEVPEDIGETDDLQEVFQILNDPNTMYLTEEEKEDFAQYPGDSVTGEMIAESVANIRIAQFSEGSYEEFAEIIKDLLDQEPRVWVLDLRGNPGGTVEDAGKILGHFIGEEEVVKAKSDHDEIICGSTAMSPKLEKPLVVMTDGISASAAELFAHAIKDQQRGLVVGERTFGKGTVQNLFPLSEGGLLTTVYEVETMEGSEIDGKGVEPHVDIVEIATKINTLELLKSSALEELVTN